MAQGDEGAPRKSKTYRDFSGMNSQNERYKIGDDEFFWMENIMRVGPRKLHSVPGPTPKLVAFPTGCPPDQPPGNQTLSENGVSHIQTGIPPGTLSGNSRTSWGFVGAGGEIIVLIGDAGATTLSANYPNHYQVIHIFPDGTITAESPVPALAYSGFFGPLVGHSDEQSYYISGSPISVPGFATYFSWTNQTATYIPLTGGSHTPGTSTFGSTTGGGGWSKFGNSLYIYLAFGTHNTIGEWDATTGVFIQEAIDAIPITITGSNNIGNAIDMQANANYLYVLTRPGTGDVLGPGGIDASKIYRFNRSDLSLDTIFSFDYQVDASPAFSSTYGMQFQAFYVVSDKLIYLIRNSIVYDNTIKPEIGYYDVVNENYTFVDRIETTISARINFAMTMSFVNGFFYLGNEGDSRISLSGGQGVNISKVGPIICVDNPAGGVLISFSDFELPTPIHIFLVSPAGDFIINNIGDFLVEN